MLRWIDVIAEALIDLLEPEAIVLRTDVPYGDLESVESGASVVRGVLPDAVVIEIDGSRFHVDPLGGQKTGFYLDQSDNRSATAEMAAGRRVLDMYTYTGAFAVACARGGAEEVLGVDSSASAVETACLNARLNGVTDVVSFEKADAVTTLRRLASEGRTFDMVILDPPPFAPNRRSVDAALRGYKEINLRAFRLLRQGGVLVTSACSHHVCRDDFISTVRAAASDAGVEARVTGWGQQPADHPILLGMPETEYLSCAFLEVC
jgi:23S rRNA (cytosine1962-C5)-methyltransferase